MSGCGDWRYIDVIPLEGGKGMGIRYCKSVYNFADDRIVVAGDSGNDIGMFKGDHHGVIVSNHQDEILKWFRRKERPNKYISDLNHADAVVEGVSIRM